MSIWSIIVAVLMLGLLAMIHECGHFFAARLLKVPVQEFSIFVGPTLFSWKKNGVDYNIRLFPFGAFVLYTGMDLDDESPDENLFLLQPRWKRLIISLAGPFMNLLSGWILFCIIFSHSGYVSNRIQAPQEDSQLAATGAGAGDTLLSINGEKILTNLDVNYILSMIPDTDPVQMTFLSEENGSTYEVELVPKIEKAYRLGIIYDPMPVSDLGGLPIVDVSPDSNNGDPVLKVGDILLSINGVKLIDSDSFDAVRESMGETLSIELVRDGIEMEVKSVATMISDVGNPRGLRFAFGDDLSGVWRHSVTYPISYFKVAANTIRDMLTGKVRPQDTLSGPVELVSIVAEVVDSPRVDIGEKISQMGLLVGFISVAFTFSNMLPIPGLDGNALVLLLVEMVRGKRLSLRTESIINVVGLVFLLLLMGFVLFSDIFKLLN